ncbi:MAG: hypothetical protein WAU49_01110 [Steroidobacteraceae bacterium]
MSLPLSDTLGWIATLVFVGSYFFSRPAALRVCQMVGAILWIAYGVLIAAKPVIASNLLVFGAAAWTLARKRDRLPPRMALEE